VVEYGQAIPQEPPVAPQISQHVHILLPPSSSHRPVHTHYRYRRALRLLWRSRDRRKLGTEDTMPEFVLWSRAARRRLQRPVRLGRLLGQSGLQLRGLPLGAIKWSLDLLPMRGQRQHIPLVQPSHEDRPWYILLSCLLWWMPSRRGDRMRGTGGSRTVFCYQTTGYWWCPEYRYWDFVQVSLFWDQRHDDVEL